MSSQVACLNLLHENTLNKMLLTFFIVFHSTYLSLEGDFQEILVDTLPVNKFQEKPQNTR